MNLSSRLSELEQRAAAVVRREVASAAAAPESPAAMAAFRRYRNAFVVCVHRKRVDASRAEVRASVERWALAQWEIVSGLQEPAIPRPSAEMIDAEVSRIMSVPPDKWTELKRNRGRAET